MDKQRGLTRIEVVVIIVVVAFIALIVIGLGIGAAILMPELQKPREQAKRAVCLNNMRQLTLAWIMYADENNNKIVNGAAGIDHPNEPPWVGKDWADDYKQGGQLNPIEQEEAIKSGALWPYCKNVTIYRCPNAVAGEMRTYSIVTPLNGKPEGSAVAQKLIVKNRSLVRRPHARVVFIDVGLAVPGNYAVYYDKEKWWDPPPVPHRAGTTFSFADGHSEYWRWEEDETYGIGRSGKENVAPATTGGRADLQRVQKAVWGKLGYTSSNSD